MAHRVSTSFDVTSLASQSPTDLRVRSEMWKGQVPILFQLAPHEVTSMEDPPPLAMLVPRQTYFPLVLQDVRTHFRDMTPAMEDELWLEYDGIPLKWTIPIGVLFDLLAPGADSAVNSGQSLNIILPWRLIVHFQSFPIKKLQRCPNLFTVRQHYLNTWKESCYFKWGSTKIAMSCHPGDHQKMWDALTHLREDIHVQTNARIISSGLAGLPSPSNPNPNAGVLLQAALENRSVQDLAIRIYLHCTRPSHEEGMNSDNHMCPIQRSVKPKNKLTGQDATVADLIQQILPSLIDPATLPSSSRPSSPTPTPTAPSTAATVSTSSTFLLLPNIRLLVQGFSPPLSTPLCWLATYASHPDGFLYFTIQIIEQETEEELAMRDPFQNGASMGGMSMGMMNDPNSMSMGGGGMSNSMLGGYGNLMSSVTNFNPTTLPGYYAASNAVNVVYQNLPSLPQVNLPSINSLFGGGANQTSNQASTQQQQPGSSLPPTAPYSSAPAGDSPVSEVSNDPLAGEMDPVSSDHESVHSGGGGDTLGSVGMLRVNEESDGDVQAQPGEDLP